jgi:hypothetical protein
MPLLNNEPLVHVATAPNEAVASIWAGILENNGIYCVLKGANLRCAYYVLLTNHHSTIHVLALKASLAKEILGPLEDDLNDYVISRGNCLSLRSRIFIVVVFLLWAFGGR